MAKSTTRDTLQPLDFRLRVGRQLGWFLEWGVLTLVILSPWAFGCVEPEFEALVYFGVAALLLLWGIRTLVELRLRWVQCPVLLSCAALFAIGLTQLLPLRGDVLAAISPAHAELTHQLLPTTPEVLPFGAPRLPVAPSPIAALSLYPTATRLVLLRIMAVLVLYAIVRNNLVSEGAFRRLSIVATANGALLAFLGLLQFFSSPPDTVYWTFHSPGAVFGPFINRNHFAFYGNLCLGLALGLFFYDVARGSERLPASPRSQRGDLPNFWHLVVEPISFQPAAWWIGIGAALMVASNAVTLSRGGLLAMLSAALVCVIFAARRYPQFLRLNMAAGIVLLASGLVVWFGLDRISQRFSTLWTGQALVESRLSLWTDTAPLIRRFWLTGTGYGTFQYVEPMYRTAPANVIFEHAHNEYLEALTEGGVTRLIIMLLLIGAVLRLAFLSLRRFAGRPEQCLLLGALFSVLTAVIHSVGEFAIHIPAIMLLLTVIAGMLCGLNEPSPNESSDAPLDRSKRGRQPDERKPASAAHSEVHQKSWTAGLIAFYGAGCAALLAFVMASYGWDMAYLQLLRRSSWQAMRQGEAHRDEALAFLTAAAVRGPDRAQLQLELARLELETYDKRIESLKDVDPTEPQVAKQREQLARDHMVPALQRLLLARDLCPLLREPQYQLGVNANLFTAADSRDQYLARVKLLAPADPEAWYLCGVQELLDDQQDAAWRSWQRSLELSAEFLPSIVEEASANLSARELMARVLPQRPDVLLAAAIQLYPQPGIVWQRGVYLESALALLSQQPQPLSAVDLALQARLHAFLAQRQEAIAAFRAALNERPDEITWRYELARLLYEDGQVQQARGELTLLLGQQPQHAEAQRLADEIAQAIAKGKTGATP